MDKINYYNFYNTFGFKIDNKLPEEYRRTFIYNHLYFYNKIKFKMDIHKLLMSLGIITYSYLYKKNIMLFYYILLWETYDFTFFRLYAYYFKDRIMVNCNDIMELPLSKSHTIKKFKIFKEKLYNSKSNKLSIYDYFKNFKHKFEDITYFLNIRNTEGITVNDNVNFLNEAINNIKLSYNIYFEQVNNEYFIKNHYPELLLTISLIIPIKVVKFYKNFIRIKALRKQYSYLKTNN